MEKIRQPTQQTTMAFQVVEDCLNLYSRDRKQKIRDMKDQDRQLSYIAPVNAIDDILNRGA